MELLTDLPERFEPGRGLLLTAPGAERWLTVASSRPMKDYLLVRFEGLDDRDAVEVLRGAYLEAEPTGEPPEGGGWWVYQLLGCSCRDRREGELGRVVDVIEDGGGDLLLVEGPRGRVPVPLVEEFLVEVDVEAGTLELDLPAGLVDACASRS